MSGSGQRAAPMHKASVSRWLIVILLSVIATCLLLEIGGLTRPAQGQPAMAGQKLDVFAVAGKITPETYGLYLVDTRRGTVCVYQYFSGSRKLRLVSARTFWYDIQLESYNCDKPTPHEVKKLVEQQRSLRDAGPSR